MEILIIILLLVVVITLVLILNKLTNVNDLIERIWHGLFNTPHGGLGRLDYLQYIHNQIEKIIKSKENKS